MKKQLLIIITLMLSWLNVAAQNSDLQSFIFVNKDGQEVQDGTVLKLTEVTEDVFGDMIKSGLSVKNVSGAATKNIRIHYIISKISGGSFQICFPTNCVTKSKAGEFYTTEGTMAVGEVRDLMAELVLDGEGECLVSVQIEQINVTGSGLTKTYEITAYGPKVTLAFNCDPESDSPEEEQTMWWGYYDGGATGGVGVSAADTYYVASHFPASNSLVNGSTIHALQIRFNSITNITNVSVWISKTLPGTVADATYSMSVPSRKLTSLFKNGVVELPLGKPYKVDGDVYVGYTFTVSKATTDEDKYPVVTAKYCDENEGLYLKTASAVPSWMGPVGSDYGALALRMQISSSNFLSDGIELLSVGDGIGLLSDTEGVPVTIQVNNLGTNGVSSIGYVVTLDGEERPEQTLDMGGTVPIIGKAWTTEINVLPAKKTGYSDLKVRLTKVNGIENPVENTEATGSFITIAESPEHKVAVEEFTGTWCGWCPRGLVAMNRFEERFGDKFVGIAVHYDDKMQISDYAAVLNMVGGFPDMFINRSLEIDPYMGTRGTSLIEFQPSLLDVEDALATPTEAGIKIIPTWNSDSTVVSARVETTFQYDRETAPYALAFVLTEDGMHGTGTGWVQSNYFYQYKQYASQFTDNELLTFINGSSSVSGLKFNHVAVAAWDIKTGRNNSISAPLVAGEVQTYNFSANISSNKVIQDKQQLRLAVLLINTKTGKIVNADKAEILSETTGIEEIIENGKLTMDNWYTLDGRRLNGRPTKSGIYIINGKKVVIK